MGKRTTLLLYIDQLDAVLPELTLEERGELLTALTEHAKSGEDQKLTSTGVRVAYSIMAKAVDANYEHYDKVSEKRAEAGRRSREAAAANANKSQQMLTNDNTCGPSTSTSTSTSTGTSITTGTSSSSSTSINPPSEDVVVGADAPTTTKTGRAAFKKPTVAEVRAYCEERGGHVDPEAFIDYYEANGWKVGRSSMKDWRAAFRTWERREKGSTTDKPFIPADWFEGLEDKA